MAETAIQTAPAAPPLPTGWRANTVIAHALSAHFWLAVVAIIVAGIKTRPWAQPYLPILNLIEDSTGGTAFVAAAIYRTPTDRAKIAHVNAAGVQAINAAAAPRTAGDIVQAKSILALLFLPLFMLASCATVGPLPAPNPAQYKQAFESCLSSEGVQQASPEVAKVWSILDQGSGTAQQIEAAVEQAALTVGGDAAIVCVDCAIVAWDTSNPVVGKLTSSQAAVRLYKAKHLSSPTFRRERAVRQ